MKSFFLFCLSCLIVVPALATYDDHDRVFLLVKHIQSGEYFFERAPIIACFGHPQEAKLLQLTLPYQVPANLGCGHNKIFYDDINYLTCAEMTKKTYDAKTSLLSLLEFDLSACPDGKDKKLKEAIVKLIQMNFPAGPNKPAVEVRFN